jgi:hypothetical protein
MSPSLLRTGEMSPDFDTNKNRNSEMNKVIFGGFQIFN